MCDDIRHIPFQDRLLSATVGAGLRNGRLLALVAGRLSVAMTGAITCSPRWPKRMKFLPGYQSYSVRREKASDFSGS